MQTKLQTVTLTHDMKPAGLLMIAHKGNTDGSAHGIYRFRLAMLVFAWNGARLNANVNIYST